MQANTSNEQNIAIGTNTLNRNIIGSYAIGTQPLSSNTSDSNGIAIGTNVLSENLNENTPILNNELLYTSENRPFLLFYGTYQPSGYVNVSRTSNTTPNIYPDNKNTEIEIDTLLHISHDVIGYNSINFNNIDNVD